MNSALDRILYGLLFGAGWQLSNVLFSLLEWLLRQRPT